VSISEPISPGAARVGSRPAAARDGRAARLRARIEALATRRNGVLLACAGAAVAMLVFLIRPTFPNYDSYYTLLWGEQLAHGHLPDYDVFRTPTPHPLSTLVAAGLSLFGEAADRMLVLISIGSYLALMALLFRFTQILLGTVVALVALAVLLTRTDIEFFALRAIVDVWFLALVFGAAVMELERPRRGWPVLAVLGLAGLLRPEAWVFAGAYWLWLAYNRVPRRELVWCAVLAAAAPVLWLISDWIVTGEPLYSLTSTRDVAGQFGRDRGVVEAAKLVPDYIGANEKIVNVIAGGLGCVLGLWLLRRRAFMPLALIAIGVGVFLAIAAAGLSVIPRYLLVPSLILNIAVALALSGWLIVRDPPWLRHVCIALAVLTVLLIGWRLPAYVKDVRALNGQTNFVSNQHEKLKDILQHPSVVPLLPSCGPITVPTHSAIPVIRYETGLGKKALVASIQQTRPPDRGLLFVGRTFNFEPSAARSTSGLKNTSARKWWSNYPLSTFRPVARNDWWQVYEHC
jgi:hypothetical protein